MAGWSEPQALSHNRGSAYVPLWVKSHHSFLEGASSPEELVETAHLYGLKTLALTDRDGLYGIVRAHVRAKELGIKLLVGSEITVCDSRGEEPERKTSVVLLAKNRKGYGDLCQLISRGRLRAPKGESHLAIQDACEAAGSLWALCSDPALLGALQDAFGDHAVALLTRHRQQDERAREEQLRRRSKQLGVRTAAAVEVLYHHKARRALQDVVTCIRHGCTLRNAGTRIRPNAEHALLPTTSMQSLFSDDPSLLSTTREVAAQCDFDLDQLQYRYPAEHLSSGLSSHDLLRKRTFEGAVDRYPQGIPEGVQAQLDRELTLIHELDYGGYFLTMHEIVQYCRSNDILCQGRGSAANSVVCYCLGITAIDPVRMGLLFERFLSKERAEPPDIDLDIEHERREEVIQHVYERYGRRHAAMVAVTIRYRPKSAVRDIGKVLELPKGELEAVSKLLSHHEPKLDPALLREAGLDDQSQSTQWLLSLTSSLLDCPRHLSIHPGGFLLGHEPVDTIVPIERATMQGRTVIQWDKQDLEDLNLFKVDLLGLGSLGAIHRCFDLLRKWDNIDLDLAKVPAEDPETYAMITRADTVGTFQIESRAQMAMLPRIRPRTFYDLVIQVAIVRPGPIQGDMVHPYLRRRSGKELVEYPHPTLKEVLFKTLGVPIFQEQVMKLAVMAAGYTGGEADQLRKDMASWRSASRIETHHERLVSRMVQHGIPEEFAERIFSQIRGFGEYGFPESHAASFALLAYITSWLKCHYPAAFLCAMLNAQPMGFYAPSTLIEDAKRHGVRIQPVDVNHSEWDCTLETSTNARSVRMGLRYVKGLRKTEAERLASGRPYESLPSLVRRTALSVAALTRLAEVGAYESFGIGRRDALWQVRELARRNRDALSYEALGQDIAFEPIGQERAVAWDYRFSSHSVRGHPMQPLRAWLTQEHVPAARQVLQMTHGRNVRYVGMVICRQRPMTATGVTFFTLEDETGFLNLVVSREVFEKHPRAARTAGVLGVTGRLQVAEDTVHLFAEDLWIPPSEAQALVTPSARNFH